MLISTSNMVTKLLDSILSKNFKAKSWFLIEQFK